MGGGQGKPTQAEASLICMQTHRRGQGLLKPLAFDFLLAFVELLLEISVARSRLGRLEHAHMISRAHASHCACTIHMYHSYQPQVFERHLKLPHGKVGIATAIVGLHNTSDASYDGDSGRPGGQASTFTKAGSISRALVASAIAAP